MKIEQLHTLVNSVTQEILGETGIVLEDLSNVVDVGKSIIDTDNVDGYVKKLVNHIGKVVFVNRVYKGSAPSVMMDAWEFGSILEKISTELPDAIENSSSELVDGQDYSPNIFHQPKVEAKFFNSRTTFEIPISFTEKQVKQSFSNAEQLNGFVSMLMTSVENSLTVKIDGLIMRTINNMIVETLVDGLDDSGEVKVGNTSIRAVNLIKLFNDNLPPEATEVTKENCLKYPEFIKFTALTMGLYEDRMTKISRLFNVEGKERFTPKDKMKTILLSNFSKAYETYLVADLQNPENVSLPKYESIPYWQGSGVNYLLEEVSNINIKTSSGNTLNIDGILGVMFDRDSIGVANLDKRITTSYNPKAEFYTNFYKFDSGYFNDLGENFVVFFLGV